MLPSNPRKPAHRGTHPRTQPAALGQRTTARQLDREKRRQDLLDQRWRRWQSIVFTLTISAKTLILPLTVSVGVLTGAIPIQRVLDWLL